MRIRILVLIVVGCSWASGQVGYTLEDPGTAFGASSATYLPSAGYPIGGTDPRGPIPLAEYATLPPIPNIGADVGGYCIDQRRGRVFSCNGFNVQAEGHPLYATPSIASSAGLGVYFPSNRITGMAVCNETSSNGSAWDPIFGDAVTELDGYDDWFAVRSLPFDFSFDGENYNEIGINTNGGITLGNNGNLTQYNAGFVPVGFGTNISGWQAGYISPAAGTATNGSYEEIHLWYRPTPTILALQTDLMCNYLSAAANQTAIHFKALPSEGRVVITWHKVETYVNADCLNTFQVQLFDDGRFMLSYNGISGLDYQSVNIGVVPKNHTLATSTATNPATPIVDPGRVDFSAQIPFSSVVEKLTMIDDTALSAPNVCGSAFGGGSTVTSDADGVRSVYATDLDGDGDEDLLSASQLDDKIAWYENTGGGAFGPQQVITTSADNARSVYATDLDGDGDADVLSASRTDDKIAWYENLGAGNGVNGGRFGAQQILSTTVNGAEQVYATDLDGDGDADVLASADIDDTIVWFENLGNGNFDAQQNLSNPFWAYDNDFHATDFDGDGDADVLVTSSHDDMIGWYENDGNGNFSERNHIADVSQPSGIYGKDLDGDGDADVLVASWNDQITWYENLGSGNFGTEQIITNTGAVNPTGVLAVDLDEDGDADVLVASHNTIAWYENVGAGNGTANGIFGPRQVIHAVSTGRVNAYAADLDGDGDTDVVKGFFSSGYIRWFANQDDGQPFDVDNKSFMFTPNTTGEDFHVTWVSNTPTATLYCVDDMHLRSFDVSGDPAIFTPNEGPLAPIHLSWLNSDAKLTGLGCESSTGLLWACDSNGNIYKMQTDGTPVGPQPVATVNSTGTLSGLAVNTSNGPGAMNSPFCSFQIQGYHIMVTDGQYIYDALNPLASPLPVAGGTGTTRGLAYSSDGQLIPASSSCPQNGGAVGNPNTGTGGPSSIRTQQVAASGNAGNGLELTSGPSNSNAVLLFDLCPIQNGGVPLPTGDSLFIWVLSPTLVMVPTSTDAFGTGVYPLPIGAAPAGLQFSYQWFFQDIANPTLYGCFSDAMTITVGLQ